MRGTLYSDTAIYTLWFPYKLLTFTHRRVLPFHSCGCLYPSPRLPCSSRVIRWNWGRRSVARMNWAAAFEPSGVLSIWRISDVLSRARCRWRLLFHLGQVRRTWRTVIAPRSQSHRGVANPGTLLSYKNALNPIFPVRSWVIKALIAFGTPTWSLRTARDGSGVSSKRWRPLMLVFHRVFHAFPSSDWTSEYIAERYLIEGFSCGPIRVADSLAALSASSFPGIPLWPGTHCSLRGTLRFARDSAAVYIWLNRSCEVVGSAFLMAFRAAWLSEYTVMGRFESDSASICSACDIPANSAWYTCASPVYPSTTVDR